MKTITEILGGAQELLDISFDLQSCFEEKLNEKQKAFLQLIRCLEEHLPPLYRPYAGTGRKPYQYIPFFRSQLAKSFFQITTTTMLIERLKADPNLRLLCGFTTVPGQASFSRAYEYLSETSILTETQDSLTQEMFKDKVVYHVCRDSTAINAREKAPRKKDKTPVKVHKKRGRPPKSEGKREKQPSEMEKQITADPYESLEKLDTKCSFGCKKNSQGNVSYWKGYKLHLDISDCGYPITACVTGANVHDSMLAIPMEKITEGKVTFCYSLMDPAYDAQTIIDFIYSHERVPVIDVNKRKNENRPPLDPAKKERYKIRTTVERANSHLKDVLIPKAIFVKGYNKVAFVLFSAVLCLAALKYLQLSC
jgi:transposase